MTLPDGRRTVGSLDALLAGASSREPLGQTDGKSLASLERVVVDGERYVLKHLHVDSDWVARGYGDLLGAPLAMWRSGLFDALPGCLDPAVVGVATGLGRNGWGAALLLRDVTPWLVPAGDAVLPVAQHLRFLDAMAALHARFWGFDAPAGLCPPSHRWLLFGPDMLELEAERGEVAVVPAIAADGWLRFAHRAPADVATLVTRLRRDPWPLLDALRATPATLVHGDWKLGNLGSHPDGRTILLDWQSPGPGPATADLGWYLALNAARLPGSKEQAVAAYRAALRRHGICTEGWFDRQLALCVLGTLLLFGWEKALGADAELAWWCDRARRGARWLG